ncbi:hypothetical protein PGUG_03043 [Meyerozyma guilliermondii ATCC 6260]|uniref:methionine--tRNA ligase n=1 Tax=Meyerozyma guilliermondii (strain ATCC 6260 / CBS 566 / DSM 6381 / JCM 1539 / NBRC 10279 / NRRL Y-324) TaxID=294746 RepID=A5DIE2_PICGU|nr:uncharacterized protein PGUG_03043 [Meyerozyma guilliermondii ATCC 6260]EDK38945.2 hypothetical protein PGUG_03043 [Meyerozyma guilliermondii ATCC 6260]
MSSTVIYGDRGSDLLALASNLKVCIGALVFQGGIQVELGEDESHTGLKDSKTGFRLLESNAIVKYLAKDFKRTEAIEFEETKLYQALKSNQKEQIMALSDLLPDFADNQEITAEKVIIFSALYVTGGENIKQKEWFEKFATLPKVKEGITSALLITTIERLKNTNTGTQKVKSGFGVKARDESLLPKKNERNILITSALPYVNNVPHLGNIVGSVLSADIYAKYVQNRNYNSLFICGTDEYGTATETKALEEKVTPQELCDKYHKVHKDVYDWFDINFDHFGRTTTPQQTEIAQDIFLKLYNNGYLEEKTTEQLYCEEHKSFLADRFVEGTCPKCGYEDARGDQCDKCGNLLDPFELINPRCKLDNAKPIPRNSTHIYLKLGDLQGELKEWFEKASTDGKWSKNAVQITSSWINRGLESRCITRDLFWGTPVPLKNYHDKVLYVWFDATIGYVSITANYFKDKNTEDWLKWWKNPEHVDLYQFMGKDNVPFHTVVFPSSQIGTRDNWTKLHHLSTTEYLQYEGGKFSKSRGVGVFGNNAKETGITPSVWRYYLASIRPETSDAQFSWGEFVTRNNSELLANLGNFVNRLVKFTIAKYNGVIPDYKVSEIPDYAVFEKDVNELLSSYIENMEAVNIRKGLELAMAISSRGNLFLQDNKLDNTLYTKYPAKSDAVVGVGMNLIYLVSSLIYPFMPSTTAQMNEILNVPPLSITNKFELVLEAGHCIGKAQYLFQRIDEKKIDEWRSLYGGKQV